MYYLRKINFKHVVKDSLGFMRRASEIRSLPFSLSSQHNREDKLPTGGGYEPKLSQKNNSATQDGVCKLYTGSLYNTHKMHAH